MTDYPCMMTKAERIRDETSKWDGMGYLIEHSKHLPELPEDMIIEIGSYLGYERDVDGRSIIVGDCNWVYTPEFYYVEPRFYTFEKPVLTKPRPRFLVEPLRKHRQQMISVNIQFLKAYDIIKGRLYYRSEEYYDSWEYQDDLDDENEERMRDAWKDERDDRWD